MPGSMIFLMGTRSSVDRAAVSGAALSGVRILSGAESLANS